VSGDQSVRRFAQGDGFVGGLKKENIQLGVQKKRKS
jgi:hypothetical protein